MKVSIAMATYNGEKFLNDQLKSFLNQTRQPDELVISDDNSSDSTIELLNVFKESSPFKVKILTSKENVGYTKNFEKALNNVTGDLVFLSDQDDVWFKNKIEKMIQISKENSDIFLFVNDTEITKEDLVPTGTTKMNQTKIIGSSINSMVMGACTLIRLEFMHFCLPFPEGFKGHDNWLHDCANIFNVKMTIPEVLQFYRIHSFNTSLHIVNNPTKINMFHYYYKKVKDYNISRLALSVSLERKKNILNWLNTQKAPQFIKNSYFYQKNAEKNISKEISIIKQRMNLYTINRGRRFPQAIEMFIKGYYAHFSGWKSMIGDILLK